MTDEPIMQSESPVKAAEIKAIQMYRAAHFDGPLWQELHLETRMMWMKRAEDSHE